MTANAPPSMLSESDWRASLAEHEVHSVTPSGDPYVLGRWHKDRASWSGYAFELRVALKSLIRHTEAKKLLMFGRSRSGTSLLRELLNQVDGFHCDGEVLHHAVASPHRFLNQLARIKDASVYGAKMLSYQMFEVQMLKSPADFFLRLADDGYTFVHVRRDTFDQALSITLAQAGNGYHIRSGETRAANTVTIDVDIFRHQMKYQTAILDYEDKLMSRIPHIVVQYEDDLKHAEQHQPTIDRICNALGHPPSPVIANLQKTSERTTITNKDALRAMFQTQ